MYWSKKNLNLERLRNGSFKYREQEQKGKNDRLHSICFLEIKHFQTTTDVFLPLGWHSPVPGHWKQWGEHGFQIPLISSWTAHKTIWDDVHPCLFSAVCLKWFFYFCLAKPYSSIRTQVECHLFCEACFNFSSRISLLIYCTLKHFDYPLKIVLMFFKELFFLCWILKSWRQNSGLFFLVSWVSHAIIVRE